ncbi:hypothetical protein MtrunA17_Chr1g0162251 [Medicago truncatula]|uniref:DUF1645 family protein n=1 Tax=Medicago truncatula TaxID=3880 RepID=A0A072VRH0_MEDTR|nr:DUF1645 family protein [Medicago truncatula]RHN78141.1 hypothetical protein MtrunA17_Chr1g0162251 [Medicago truncatula]
MMEKEVMVALPSIDFNFNFNTNFSSTPYIKDIDEHEPINNNDENDFEFNFNTHLPRSSLSADELFHAGKILPLNLIDSDIHHHQQETKKKLVEDLAQQEKKLACKERSSSFSILSCRSNNTKYSKLSHDVFSHEKVKGSSNNIKQSETSTFSSFLSTISFTKGYRKWRFKDFLLFRSASEGRGSDKDPLRKYRVLSKTTVYEDVGNSSFRSVENSGSVSKRRKPVSAHELHYTLNRAASEELKRKTMLPYKQGLLGCLGFNHGMSEISGRFGSFERS